MLNESRALLILVTTPFGRFQTSTSVEQMRQVARFYNDCSSDEEEYSSVRNWAQEIVDESGVACEFQPNMVMGLL
jgi:hypothetical protein